MDLERAAGSNWEICRKKWNWKSSGNFELKIETEIDVWNVQNT